MIRGAPTAAIGQSNGESFRCIVFCYFTVSPFRASRLSTLTSAVQEI